MNPRTIGAWFLCAGLWVATGVSAPAAAPVEAPQKSKVGREAREDVMVTAYNNGYGLVREVRRLTLPTGTVELEVSDVAEKIDATSVAFKSLTAPDKVGILEQNYRYDLLSPETLLNKFIGRKIRVSTVRMQNNTQAVETRDGTLLSTQNGTIVQFADGAIAINPPGSISVAEVPPNLLSRPTLVWLLGNKQQGEQKIEVSYLTNGMNWNADYVATVDAEDKQMDWTGWVTLNNQTGATYENAQLKLVAGEVRRVMPPQAKRQFAENAPMAMAGAPPQFEEKAFFEYHLYTLQRRTTLANRETKQVTLLEARQVPVEKLYMIESPPWTVQQNVRGKEKRDVQVAIQFENKEANHMGMPLPAGRVRVYKADTDKSLQLVGEDKINHTPKDEKVRLILGNAFDVVAERSQTNYKRIADNVVELSYNVTIRNHKKEDVRVGVMEHVYGDWEMLNESLPHAKLDARTIQFMVPVKADGESELTYRVRVTW